MSKERPARDRLSIDPKHLANLLAVAQTGSFNRAAAERGISQPALSSSIAQLERRLGVQVFDRSRRGSELNEYGKILLRSARSMESLLLQTSEEINAKKVGSDGPLRIGVTPSLMLKFMPGLIQIVLNSEPHAAISLIEGLDDQLLAQLRSGELDLVFGPLSSLFPTPSDILEEALFEDAFTIGVGPRNPIRSRKYVTLSELSDRRWVLPGPGSAYRRHVESLFRSQGVNWPIECVVTSSLALVESIVACTDRVTLITEMQTNLNNIWDIHAVPLKQRSTRTLGIKRRCTQELSPLILRVIKAAHEQSAQLRARLPKRHLPQSRGG